MTWLRVQAHVRSNATTRLQVDLTVPRGTTAAILGPNGAGKTTLLRTVAGLVDPGVDAQLTIAGRDVTDSPPAQRRVGYVPQHGALFPHLSVLDNVAYGLRAAGERKAKARELASVELERLGCDDLAERNTRSLSGGQVQRVALARALAVDPDVLLLDEPTASLDATGRADVQSLLRQHLGNFRGATLFVTHDAAEALTIASQMVVLAEGRVVQDDLPHELVRAPGSPWVAQFLNLNAWAGHVISDGQVALDRGGLLFAVELPPPGCAVLVTLSPTSITLSRQAQTSSARNVWPVRVLDARTLGNRVRLRLAAADPANGPTHAVAEVTTAATRDLAIEPGSPLWASVKATDVAVGRTP